MTMKTWTATVEEDENGEPILVFPEGCLPEDWIEGTTVEWVDQKDGSWLLRKKEMEETEFVLVDCVSTFRMRYLVEVPKGKSEWALDTVTCQEAKEFSQEHIGEQIVSHRAVSKDEAIQVCDIDNHYCSSWTEEQKVNAFFTLRKDYE